ncbi:hypothetical protein RO3G_08589 [Lichtheimia corymbifera JMRC:FSU:9682]|uniref:Uncharacterized protein n=1 Tax=Lichtheimia corymbifera JMRC:FSU:9682 TaxID=1263082 RepID=A0A068S4P1_9FUNG|nr:hypothetical protein RO3G_08589 [Lichtheimia corymbifera JMRC:FSU:9682]
MTADIIDGEGYSVSSSSTQHVPELVDSRSSSSDISIKKKKQHRRRTIEIDGDADSDKDLVISTLTESLQMHKEIMEELQREKDAFVADLKREREEEKQANRKEKEDALESMEAQLQRYRQLEEAYSLVVNELEAKKNEYRRMETSFYEHVKSIRPTDDDLSTIQYEINHLANLLNNLCMSLKSKMDRTGGTTCILDRWGNREFDIRHHFLQSDDVERLEPGVITMFTEKMINEILRAEIFDQPIHAGVSINHTFKEICTWIEERNTDWANRLRQQVSALVVRHPGAEEQARMEQSLDTLVDLILDHLTPIYPRIRDTASHRKKIENIVARAARLNLAMKGQDINVFCGSIQEEKDTRFDSSIMKPTSRGDQDGHVLFVISFPFIAVDPKDPDNGFVIPAKVFCVADNVAGDG